MDEYIDTLADACIFTALYAFNGYWQIDVQKEDRDKNSFVFYSGQLQYTRIPFSLTTAQKLFNVAWTSYSLASNRKPVSYTLMTSWSSRNLSRSTPNPAKKSLLPLVMPVNLKVKECKFFKYTVEYIGHVIKPRKLEMGSTNTKSLRDAKQPTTKNELWSFRGLIPTIHQELFNERPTPQRVPQEGCPWQIWVEWRPDPSI